MCLKFDLDEKSVCTEKQIGKINKFSSSKNMKHDDLNIIQIQKNPYLKSKVINDD